MMLEIPTNCPVCSSALDRVNDQLFCRNQSCDAKSLKALQHFVKTMKIKGLGEKTLEKLSITDIEELYEFTEKDLCTVVGSQKIGAKLYTEISSSREVPVNLFIQSFGITLIGNSASVKLAKYTNSLWEIDKEICSKAGLGEKATNYLLQWIKRNRDRYSTLPITMKAITIQSKPEELYKVCITGKLDNFSSRNKAKEFLENEGATVMSGISSKINYLVCDDSSRSSKHTKAESLNIPIITMNDLLNKIKGDT